MNSPQHNASSPQNEPTGETPPAVCPPAAPDEIRAPAASLNRRSFLGKTGAVTAGTLLGTLMMGRQARAEELNPLMPADRLREAFGLRQRANADQQSQGISAHPTNDDDTQYPDGRISYSKALPHNSYGIVAPNAYCSLRSALRSGRPADFEAIPIAGATKLTDPQAALAFDSLGGDPQQFLIPPAPGYSSAETAAEMVELYWQALTRDIPFNAYGSISTRDNMTSSAAQELSGLPKFSGPRDGNGQVTPQTLFRLGFPGALTGPYLSQFLLMPIPYGALPIEQQIRTVLPKSDYLTTYQTWLDVQNGAASGPSQFDPTRRYIRNARDIAELVHRDFPQQIAQNACLILLNLNAPDEPLRLYADPLRTTPPFDPGNPYGRSRNQQGFVVFGAPEALDLVTDIADDALRAAWFQKWSVHRRLRPEEFGGRIHNLLTASSSSSVPPPGVPIDASVLKSDALTFSYKRWQSYLLPQAFPEGCPTHPAYPSGHAVYIGAQVTVLKAFFNEDAVFTAPVQAASDGLSLQSYSETTLTVGGELNKLASNIAIARNGAGVHWRTDAFNGVLLGEEVAIRYLQDQLRNYNQSYYMDGSFRGYTLTRFNGKPIQILPNGVITAG